MKTREGTKAININEVIIFFNQEWHEINKNKNNYQTNKSKRLIKYLFNFFEGGGFEFT